MFDRPTGGKAAVLVGIDFGEPGFAESLEELRVLAMSAGMNPRSVVQGKRGRPDPTHFAGKGKVEEIRLQLILQGAELVVFNHPLSPAQERNIEKALECRVLDRTSLILGIFALRAQSHEGKLQVELANLEHISTRLIRGWTHLERQRGGIGLRGGPGETQLEVDRRLLSDRMKVVKEKLSRLKRQRDVQRRSRSRAGILSVSLVGYTNAGKSTLFNTLTHAGTYVADKLFATLDTKSRRLYLPEAGNIVISDTVGFIRELPTTLVAAFRATLEETIQADLLLHVVDATSEVRDAQVEQVNQVLVEIGASDIPQLLVWNKIDLNGGETGFDRDEYGKICRVRLSAKTADGVAYLRQALIEAAASRQQSINSIHTKPNGIGRHVA
ncbi:MAG: GTPase HflX [Betaproteobacteria bacterium]|nr:GTPase HflX [Betaproteobacteria bacterium]